MNLERIFESVLKENDEDDYDEDYFDIDDYDTNEDYDIDDYGDEDYEENLGGNGVKFVYRFIMGDYDPNYKPSDSYTEEYRNYIFTSPVKDFCLKWMTFKRALNLYINNYKGGKSPTTGYGKKYFFNMFFNPKATLLTYKINHQDFYDTDEDIASIICSGSSDNNPDLLKYIKKNKLKGYYNKGYNGDNHMVPFAPEYGILKEYAKPIKIEKIDRTEEVNKFKYWAKEMERQKYYKFNWARKMGANI